MGFTHVCVAPLFEPGSDGDIFVHATFNRLHPALLFEGTAENGVALAVELAGRAGLQLLLDIAPGQVARRSELENRHPDWFDRLGSERLADPRGLPRRIDVSIVNFSDSAQADAICNWWIDTLRRLIDCGVCGFRCLTLELTAPPFWRRLISTFPDTLFVAWTPSAASLSSYAGIGFDLACMSTERWDGSPTRFFNDFVAARGVAPTLVSPEPSFMDRLIHHLDPGTNITAVYQVALRTAATMGAGLFMPMGFEHATGRLFDPVYASPKDYEIAVREQVADLSEHIADAIHLAANLGAADDIKLLTSPAAKLTVFLRGSSLIVINPDLAQSSPIEFPLVPIPFVVGSLLEACSPESEPLMPAEVRIVKCRPVSTIEGKAVTLDEGLAKSTKVVIERLEPGDEFAAKTIIGQNFTVSADIFSDGHDALAADLLWRADDALDWQRLPMHRISNDRWQAVVRPDRLGLYQYSLEAWRDEWSTFTHDLSAKAHAGHDVSLEVIEGNQLASRTLGPLAREQTVDDLLSSEMARRMKLADSRPFATRSAVYSTRVDRPAAQFASWYELFPRSVTHDAAVHGNFRAVIRRLPEIEAMGFDVLYFPPIHPIGRVNRKGRNNSLSSNPGDVGSPYAIGSAEGGHDAIHPQLGTLEDFKDLLTAAARHGLEIAIDFAIQCAPDHPWITQHKDWFRWRADGSMRYAENPPKKYEDIVNPEFYGDASFPSLWIALRDVIQFWIDCGVRTFRVDNPHTKPLPFWQWMIADIQSRHPDVLFLAEAFTRPKLMYRLAKLGFSESYTYFTWRNNKQEIIAYLTELTTPPASAFFRPNFFVNTPDINPVYLQTSGRPGFLIRAVLAATLSGLWGIYSGFEICEATPLPGREEYLDSEKYQIRPRDYNQRENIIGEIAALNRIRRQHPALQSHLGVTFYTALNDQILLYGKRDPFDHSMVLVCVTLDPHNPQEAVIDLPLWEFGLGDDATLRMTDVMSERNFFWHGRNQRIRLDPRENPYYIWRVEAP